MLAPGKIDARSAAKNILYNKNYYVQEIGAIVNQQFGTDTWVYDNFVTELTDDIVHDLITTDVNSTTRAYKILINTVTGNFKDGEIL